MTLNIEACQDKQHFLALLVHHESTTKNKVIHNFWMGYSKTSKTVYIEILKEEIKSVALEKHEFESRDESL